MDIIQNFQPLFETLLNTAAGYFSLVSIHTDLMWATNYVALYMDKFLLSLRQQDDQVSCYLRVTLN